MFIREVVLPKDVWKGTNSANTFVNQAQSYKSKISICKARFEADAKSLLGILALDVTAGTKVRLIADGPDEERAVTDLVGMLESGTVLNAVW